MLRILKSTGIGLIAAAALWMLALFGVAAWDDASKTVRKMFDAKEDPRAFLVSHRGSRLALQIYRDMNASGREYHPLIEWKSRPVQLPTLNIDQRGLRLHQAGKDNNLPDAQPIGFFGGSATFGVAATDDNTIPSFFDVITNNYIVANYAQNGWTARQNLAHLINLIADGEALKVVVFYDGYNDVRNLCNRGVTSETSGTSMEGRYRSLIKRGRSVDGIYNALVAPIMNKIKTAAPEFVEDYICTNDPLAANRVADALVRTWEMARMITEGNGGRFFAFLQPSRFTGKPRIDYLPPGSSDGARADLLQREFDAVYPLIREKLAETDMAWADLSDAFDGDQPFYVDFVHVVGEGNRVIAERMRDRIAVD